MQPRLSDAVLLFGSRLFSACVNVTVEMSVTAEKQLFKLVSSSSRRGAPLSGFILTQSFDISRCLI